MATDVTTVTVTSELNLSNVSEKQEQPSFYPPFQWGLGHIARTSRKMFIKDILTLTPMEMFPMAYDFMGHPIYKVEIVGNLVLVDSRRLMDLFVVDDGTGCIKAVLWKKESNLIDAETIASLGTKMAAIELGSLVSFTGRIKTYQEKNEITLEGCNRLVNWHELVIFRELTLSAYTNIFFKPCKLPFEVIERLKEYHHEITCGRKSKRWYESLVEQKVLEALKCYTNGAAISVELFENQDVLNQLSKCLETYEEIGIENLSLVDNVRGNASMKKVFTEILYQMESKGLIYFLPLGMQTAHLCVLVSKDCGLAQLTISKLKQLATAETTLGEGGYTANQILSLLRRSEDNYCLVQKVALEKCLEILEDNSDIYSIGKFKYMPI